jgi:hypothetical protein
MTATRYLPILGMLFALYAARPAAQAQETPPPDDQAGAAKADQPPATSAPADDQSDARSPRQPSVEAVLEEFQKQRPKAEPLLPSTGADEASIPATTESAAGAAHMRFPDGYFLVDRTGRLVRDGSWWVFVFVSDNNPDQSPDPPMKLLPNRMLERMVRESQDGTETVYFIVSGEVTDFMGENYLLLRKLLRKRDLGNHSN